MVVLQVAEGTNVALTVDVDAVGVLILTGSLVQITAVEDITDG